MQTWHPKAAAIATEGRGALQVEKEESAAGLKNWPGENLWNRERVKFMGPELVGEFFE